MNIAYFRKSKYSLEDTIKNVKDIALNNNWKDLGTIDLNGKGSMILICKNDWINDLLEEEHELLGFLPCSITIFKKGDEVLIGSGEPSVIKALARTATSAQMAAQAEVEIKQLINESAGVEGLKVKNIKLYSTTTCPYCTMEKQWLEENKVKFDQVLVDKDSHAAEDMVKATGQMGVPVTEVQYEEGDSEYVIGFDRNKLSSLLGLTP